MTNTGQGRVFLLLSITMLWLGGCASHQPTTTTYQSSAGTVPRIDASALSAPRTPTPIPAPSYAGGPALLPVVAHNSLAPPTLEPAVYREIEPAPEPRQRRRASSKPSRQAARRPAASPEPEPPPPSGDRISNGSYHWDDDGGGGPVKVVVNLDEQQAYVYRNNDLIGQSSVSTGRKGYRTPTGTFEILQKKKRHTSNIYKGAKMPYMQRLTWGGIALHGGDLPGYPASHGCIRLPMGFAKKLFETTNHGTQVVVTKGA